MKGIVVMFSLEQKKVKTSWEYTIISISVTNDSFILNLHKTLLLITATLYNTPV